jgi:hypothetical protein
MIHNVISSEALGSVISRGIHRTTSVSRVRGSYRTLGVCTRRFHVGGVSTEGKIRDAGGVDEPNRIDTYRIEDDIVEGLRRIYCYAKRVARVGVPDGGQTKTT